MRGEGPTLIEAMMYRLHPHSTSDNDLLYRTKEEIEQNWAQDGIPRYKQYLIECGIWSEEQDQELSAQIKQEVIEAGQYADNASFPDPQDTMRHVYAVDGGRD
jgi:2-oxoisovalerate dehydrogenase E1 component alpha subunit